MKRLLFVSSTPAWNQDNWPLANSCKNHYEVEVVSVSSCPSMGDKYVVLKTLLGYFNMVLYCLKNRKRYDALVFWAAKNGIILAIFARIFRMKLPKMILYDLVIFQRRSFVCTIVEDYLTRYALKVIDCVIVSAEGLVDHYYKTYHFHGCIYYLPESIDIDMGKKGEIGDYIFSGGLSLRDWPTILKAAKHFSDTRFVISGSSNDKILFTLEWPENVSIFYDLPISEHYKLLSKSKFVVVAFTDENAAAGHLTFLHSFDYGKAVVSSKMIGVGSYINHGYNGLLFNHKDANDLIEKANLLLKDSNLIRTLGHNAKKTSENFSHEKYLQRFHQILDAEVL